METSRNAGVAEQLRAQRAAGATPGRALRRLTDVHATTAAAAALQASATRMSGSGTLAVALKSAHALWSGWLDDARFGTDEAHDRLRQIVMTPEFLGLVPAWIRELREIAAARPDTGACTIASAFDLWRWTVQHFRDEPSGSVSAMAALDDLADVLCPLLGARALALDVGRAAPAIAVDLELRADLCHAHAARAAAAVGTACAELVFGYRVHPRWDAAGCAGCYGSEELDALEGLIPGIASGARASSDVIEADGSHAAKAGPCARFEGVDTFVRLRARLDGCLTGARIARDRAAARLAATFTDSAKD